MGIVRPHRSAPVVAKAVLAACICPRHDHAYSALRHIDPWIRLVASRTGHPDQIAIVFVLQIAIACVPLYCNPCCLAIAFCCDLRAGVESFHVVASIVSNRRVNLSNLLQSLHCVRRHAFRCVERCYQFARSRVEFVVH